MDLKFGVLVDYFPQFVSGTQLTLFFSAGGLLLAVVIGLFATLGRLSRLRLLRATSRAYTDLIRGTPLLVQIFFIYFGLPQFGLTLSAPEAGVVAMGVNSGAYVGEIFRGGIQSIDPGQMEAARSVGMSYPLAMRRVVLPQAIRRIIPALTGEATNLVKGTSLLAVISIGELTRVAQLITGNTFRPFEAYTGIAVVYFVINFALSQASILLERRLGAAHA
ncbi:MAG: amino acid ABC transporter permease [Candidatus Limnocylindrales bacterium]